MDPVARTQTFFEKYETKLDEFGTNLQITKTNASIVQGASVAGDVAAGVCIGVGIPLCFTPPFVIGIAMVAAGALGLAGFSTVAHIAAVKKEGIGEKDKNQSSAPEFPPIISEEDVTTSEKADKLKATTPSLNQRSWTNKSATLNSDEIKKEVIKKTRNRRLRIDPGAQIAIIKKEGVNDKEKNTFSTLESPLTSSEEAVKTPENADKFKPTTASLNPRTWTNKISTLNSYETKKEVIKKSPSRHFKLASETISPEKEQKKSANIKSENKSLEDEVYSLSYSEGNCSLSFSYDDCETKSPLSGQRKWTQKSVNLSPKSEDPVQNITRSTKKKVNPEPSSPEEEDNFHSTICFNFGNEIFKAEQPLPSLPIDAKEVTTPDLTNGIKPGKALSILFDFAKDINLNLIVNNTLEGNETSFLPESMIKALSEKLKAFDETGTLARLLENNSSSSKIRCILGAILKKASPLSIASAVLTGAFNSWSSKDSKDALEPFYQLPQIKNLIAASYSLKKYYEGFKNSDKGFQLEDFCVSFLKDDSLFCLWDTDEKIILLATLCSLAEIPKFGYQEAYEILTICSRLHYELANLRSNERNGLFKYMDILNLFLVSGNKDLINLACEFLEFVNKPSVSHTVSVYLQPLLTPIHLLALPRITQIFIQISRQNLSSPYKCQKTFEEYKEKLGTFFDTPIATYIHALKLDKYCFTHILEIDNLNALNIKFENLIFENFSFVASNFKGIHFKGVNFLGCNFNKSQFFGETQFSNVCIDEKTAETFLKSLKKSMIITNHLQIRGSFTIIKNKDCLHEGIKSSIIPKQFKTYVKSDKYPGSK
ncbi:MAG: hypothetical protein H0T62_12250 [Parachlamydiaceae bacterium]|nr:hypothetical protein [Parachlamydiaceae bacterium]